MTRTLVGKVDSLWRYPVKSMLGEQLKAVDVTPKGLLGDRSYAVWDRQTQRIASAKNPKKWAKLLEFQAKFLESPQTKESIPPVTFAMPDGSAAMSNNRNIDAWINIGPISKVQQIGIQLLNCLCPQALSLIPVLFTQLQLRL
jgi:uncharacterized protein